MVFNRWLLQRQRSENNLIGPERFLFQLGFSLNPAELTDHPGLTVTHLLICVCSDEVNTKTKEWKEQLFVKKKSTVTKTYSTCWTKCACDPPSTSWNWPIKMESVAKHGISWKGISQLCHRNSVFGGERGALFVWWEHSKHLKQLPKKPEMLGVGGVTKLVTYPKIQSWSVSERLLRARRHNNIMIKTCRCVL